MKPVAALQELLDSLPQDHHERAGLMRAIEFLRVEYPPPPEDFKLNEHEEAEAVATIDAFMALKFGMGGRPMAYKGLMDGEVVIILGAANAQADHPGHFESKPLAVVWNKALYEAIEVPGTKVPWT
jgi:hypothetical protein